MDYGNNISGFQIFIINMLANKIEETSSSKGQSTSMTIEEIDILLEKYLLQELHTTVKTMIFPCLEENLY